MDYTNFENILSQITPTDNFRRPNGMLEVLIDTPRGEFLFHLFPVLTGEWILVDPNNEIDSIFAPDEVISFLQREHPIDIKIIPDRESTSSNVNPGIADGLSSYQPIHPNSNTYQFMQPNDISTPSPIYSSTNPESTGTLGRIQGLLGQLQQTIPMIQQIGTTVNPIITSVKSIF